MILEDDLTSHRERLRSIVAQSTGSHTPSVLRRLSLPLAVEGAMSAKLEGELDLVRSIRAARFGVD